MVVVAPFVLAETIVTAEEDPVAQYWGVTVRRSCFQLGDDLRYHTVVDHFALIGDVFVLQDSVCRRGDVVYGDLVWGKGSWQLV
jgi:hypothetical protein